MNDDEDIRWATETGVSQIEFYRTRMEEARERMLICKNRFWLKSGAPIAEWRPVRDEYWESLDNWHASIADLWRAKKEARHGAV